MPHVHRDVYMRGKTFQSKNIVFTRVHGTAHGACACNLLESRSSGGERTTLPRPEQGFCRGDVTTVLVYPNFPY